jgi:dTDP-4-dehydrorhamnose 3,5-epimerase
MKIVNTNIDAVKIIEQFKHNDARGSFVKTFHYSSLSKAGIDFNLKESFYSTSNKNVIRGMHFHLAPFGHDKIVFCTAGAILDVALDLRKDKASYGQFVTCELSEHNNKALYIPRGFAHGFLSLSGQATTYYLVDGEYNAAHDAGILYNSFGFSWPCAQPILNERDLSFEPFAK